MELIRIEGKPAQVFDIVERMAKLHGGMTLGDLQARGITVVRQPITPEAVAEYQGRGRRKN